MLISTIEEKQAGNEIALIIDEVSLITNEGNLITDEGNTNKIALITDKEKMNMNRWLNRTALTVLLAGICTAGRATVYDISVPDASTWSNEVLAGRSYGDTVRFSVPVIVNNNYGNSLTVSVRRVYSPTNQAIPKSAEYTQVEALNGRATFTLSGCGYRRLGERLLNLKGVVTGTLQVKYVSGTWAGNNTRTAIEHTIPNVDMKGEHNVLVCAANLEYYLVENLGTGYGPDDDYDHQKQRTKVKKALAEIHADVYGLVEIEQGQSALAEIASDLSEMTGDPYDYIDDKGSANSSYTKSGYVYRSDRIQPIGMLSNNNTGVRNRKKAQGFILTENNERFIYSINHFKAKSGNGTGRNADQGDGQGIYNYDRTMEAISVRDNIPGYQNFYGDNDVLIMGDLNAYAKEDPIRTLTDADMYDLHRYFHADSSYSYVYHGVAGYLDHAIANKALINQVTGMAAWHVNSDESDNYTYDKSNDLTVFRYSDHDPVLVGLRLDSTKSTSIHGGGEPIDQTSIEMIDGEPFLTNVGDLGEQHGYYEIYSITGNLIQGTTRIEESPCPIGTNLPAGIYVLRVYYAGKIKALKMRK